MAKRLSRIAPWQAGKIFAIIYFFMSFIFVIPLLLLTMFAPMPHGPGPRMGPGMLILFPFLYALAGLIFVPLGCWLYNIAANMVGGLQVSVVDEADA
jgi:hypothetical protein